MPIFISRPLYSLFQTLCLSASAPNWASGCNQQVWRCDYDALSIWKDNVCVSLAADLDSDIYASVCIIKLFSTTFIIKYRDSPPHSVMQQQSNFNSVTWHWIISSQTRTWRINWVCQSKAKLVGSGGLKEIFYCGIFCRWQQLIIIWFICDHFWDPFKCSPLLEWGS